MKRLIMCLLSAAAVYAQKDAVLSAAETVNSLAALLKSFNTNAVTRETREANEAVKAKISAVFDFSVFSQEALGRNWAKQTKANQDMFSAKLRQCIEVYGYRRASTFFNRVDSIAVVATVPSGNAEYAVQTGQVRTGDKTVSLSAVYKTELIGGRRVITDIWYDIGVTPKQYDEFVKGLAGSPKWLVALYREQFDGMLRKESIGGVFKKMDTVIAQHTPK